MTFGVWPRVEVGPWQIASPGRRKFVGAEIVPRSCANKKGWDLGIFMRIVDISEHVSDAFAVAKGNSKSLTSHVLRLSLTHIFLCHNEYRCDFGLEASLGVANRLAS